MLVPPCGFKLLMKATTVASEGLILLSSAVIGSWSCMNSSPSQCDWHVHAGAQRDWHSRAPVSQALSLAARISRASIGMLLSSSTRRTCAGPTLAPASKTEGCSFGGRLTFNNPKCVG